MTSTSDLDINFGTPSPYSDTYNNRYMNMFKDEN